MANIWSFRSNGPLDSEDREQKPPSAKFKNMARRSASPVLIDAESLLEAPLSIPNRPEFAPFEDIFRRNY